MKKILKINNLDKSFGGVHAVNNVSFEVEEGEILGLIGPNGSGKSTCVNLISGVYTPDSGEVIFNGQNITKMPVPNRADIGIGRTFQSPKPFTNLTVYDSVFTIALLHHKHMKDAVKKTKEILELTGLANLSDVKSGKLPIEKRKWLDLARILAIHPKLIMLDEVMAGLNPSEMEESIKLVQKINREGITIIFIEHVMTAVMKLCHRVIVLNEGSLLSQGMPSEVMQEEAVIKAYLGGGYANAKN
ncbi:ABC transporter ATP-binding protein [Petroclostridium xylanilyticum]|uniref:ABC transporter ATP-binding protein n=1 Tax=Petroclostridium xylanilyticum TaxID=1792311 RepID=UPI0012FFCB6B|nr:ABC transporter ATP-binding protein [Petroclostridium xylanilyticum]